MLRASCEHQTDIGKPEYAKPAGGDGEVIKRAFHFKFPLFRFASHCAAVWISYLLKFTRSMLRRSKISATALPVARLMAIQLPQWCFEFGYGLHYASLLLAGESPG
jgi:hypothetical protein